MLTDQDRIEKARREVAWSQAHLDEEEAVLKVQQRRVMSARIRLRRAMRNLARIQRSKP